MRLPELMAENSSRDFVEAFGGYNHNIRIGENEFYDMKNLTSDYYPVLSPRKKRGTYPDIATSNIVGMIEKDAFCYVVKEGDDLMFYMNNDRNNLGFTEIDESVERHLVSMGAYVIVMPDKKYINTADTDDKGNIEADFDSTTDIVFTLCKADGTEYDIKETGSAMPVEIEEEDEEGNEKKRPVQNGDVWLDTSSTPATLKVFSSAQDMWTGVATVYIKIKCKGIGAKFDEYDGVKISGITADQLEDLNNTNVIYAKDDDWIVVVGIMDCHEITQVAKSQIKVERKMPEMDFIIESNNRLWGCRYGTNNDGDIVNELYACKLGSFKNWNCFMGISTDSYYVSLGTDGQFTGAYSYLGYPTFFKENCIHTVYGNYPAEYQVQDTACRGVQKGSSKSLAMVDEALYYKSRTGICTYTGSLPTEISAALGEKHYTEAVGCSHKGKYYVSMKDAEDGKFYLFVCDTKRGLWHKEDALQVKSFCVVDDEIYFIDTGEKIRTMFGSGTTDTEPIEWMAETGIIGCSSPDKKYVSRISIRLKLDIGSFVRFSIQYDSEGEWHHVCSLVGSNLRTSTLPIRPMRCDHFRLRIEGTGEAKVFSISKTMEQGSEL